MDFANEWQPNRADESSTAEEPKAGFVWRVRSYLKMEACPLRFYFTKADRILKRGEYLALSKSGKKVQNTEFIAYFLPARHSPSRLGVTVTKKVGQAVERNRIKRIVREFFRINRHCLSGRWDINIIAKRQSAGIRSEKAYRSLQKIFELISRHDGHQ
jgi:ribonuclease P protein component